MTGGMSPIYFSFPLETHTYAVISQMGLGTSYSINFSAASLTLIQGPELMTCGPYRPIILRSYGLRIKDVYPRASLRPDGKAFSPYLNAQITLSGASASSAGSLSLPEGAKLSLQLIDKATNSVIVTQQASPTTLDVLAKLKGEDGECVGEGADEDLAVVEFGEAWSAGSKKLGEEIKAWWPVGYGEQPLYDVKVQLLDKVRL